VLVLGFVCGMTGGRTLPDRVAAEPHDAGVVVVSPAGVTSLEKTSVGPGQPFAPPATSSAPVHPGEPAAVVDDPVAGEQPVAPALSMRPTGVRRADPSRAHPSDVGDQGRVNAGVDLFEMALGDAKPPPRASRPPSTVGNPLESALE
jgi:hypothetical protein